MALARRRSSKLLYLIGIPVIGFGLAKGGMHFYVQQELDKLILDASPYASISYQKLETRLTGKITVTDILIKPVGQSDAVKIHSANIVTPDALTYALNHLPVIGNPDLPPEHLRLYLDGIEMNLTGDVADALDAQQAAAGKMDTCMNPNLVSLDLLRQIGMNTLQADADMSYHYNPKHREFRVDVDAEIKDVQKTRFNLGLSNMTLKPMKSVTAQMPSIKEAEIAMRIEPAYGAQASAWCAKKMNMDVADYEEFAAKNLIYHTAKSGVRLGNGLKNVITNYYKNWGSIDLTISPPTPLNPLSLMLQPPAPDKMEETLGLQLTVNKRLITDLSFHLQKNAPLFSPKKQTKSKQPKAAPIVQYRMVSRAVSPRSLSSYLYKRVQLELKDGTDRNGILMDISGGELELEQRLNGGKFTAFVAMSDIKKAQVRLREEIVPKRGVKK